MADQPLETRSGLASSTRETALKLWGGKIPPGPPVESARQLFACENPPGTAYVSGSQDALGILLPGISRLHYTGEYWPAEIESLSDPATIAWLESKLFLKWLGPRPGEMDPWARAVIEHSQVAELAAAAEECWAAIQGLSMADLCRSIERTFRAQTALFPATTNDVVSEVISRLRRTGATAKLAGAGGLGYLIIAADRRPEGAMPIHIRRPEIDSL